MPLTTTASPSVTDALNTRITVRDFLDTPVPEDMLMNILETARRTPSGGNLQPWKVHVLRGEFLAKFIQRGFAFTFAGKRDVPSYPAYPSPLWEPQRSWRYKVGEDMYSLLGIAKDDKPARIRQFMENIKFFGAPVGIVITGHKDLDMPQHLDVGIYLQSLMLLAREAGLHSAPQGWWRQFPTVCNELLNIPENEEILVGMSLGYGNPDAPVNELYSDRAELSETVQFYS